MNNTTGTTKRTKKTVLNLVLNKGREKIMIINERKKDRFIMFVQYIYMQINVSIEITQYKKIN